VTFLHATCVTFLRGWLPRFYSARPSHSTERVRGPFEPGGTINTAAIRGTRLLFLSQRFLTEVFHVKHGQPLFHVKHFSSKPTKDTPIFPALIGTFASTPEQWLKS